GRRGARDSHRARGGRLLRAGVPPRPRAGVAGALGREIRVGGHVLHAFEGRQQVLHVRVRRPAAARPGRDGGAALPLLWCAYAQGWGCRGSRMTLPAPAPGPWQHWDLHPSVIIGLVLLGGLYVFWEGLHAPRRRVASFAGALVVLGMALNGPLHNLSDAYLFSAHMVQHLVFLATAVIMWWPVLSPLPELPRASYGTQLLYLFALGLPMSLAGALITLADGVLYPFYVSAPRVWGLTPAADQQLGGLLM